MLRNPGEKCMFNKITSLILLLCSITILTISCGSGTVNYGSNGSNESSGSGGTGGTANGGSQGTATLAWNPPSTNADGTPLTGLAGFKVYYGTQSGTYPNVIDVGNRTRYVLNNLPSGTYYFVVTAYDTSGTESGFSNELSKAIL